MSLQVYYILQSCHYKNVENRKWLGRVQVAQQHMVTMDGLEGSMFFVN